MQMKRSAVFGALLAVPLTVFTGNIAAQDSTSGLEQALRNSGWSVQREEDGSLILMPQGSPEIEKTQDQWQKMQSDLQATGWSVDREADGTLILIPPVQATAASPEVEDPMQDIKQKLRETGWTVSTSADGSMLLYPPGTPVSSKPAPVAGSPSSAQITLPVDSWREAYDISRDWLASQPEYGATVGKIRKINRIYLVSIVAENAPHGLLQQIAIRAGDASVIVLN